MYCIQLRGCSSSTCRELPDKIGTAGLLQPVCVQSLITGTMMSGRGVHCILQSHSSYTSSVEAHVMVFAIIRTAFPMSLSCV